jgi:hypothetical protein
MMAGRRALSVAVLIAIVFGVACNDDSDGTPSGSGGNGTTNASGGTTNASGGAASVSGGNRNGTAGSNDASGGAPDSAGGTTSNAGTGDDDAGSPSQGAAGAAQGSAGAPGQTYECEGSGSRFVTRVVAHEFGSGQSFGQDKFPESVFGPPRGGLCCGGSLDVTSLGDGGWVVLEFENNVIVDGDGPDFLIFENAFVPSDAPPESVFAELGEVSVSQDGETWFTFPCTAESYPFGDCAGWHATFANVDTNSVDPTDPSVAGGDPFDLSELGLGWARYVRIQDRPELDGGAGTFDLDAAAIVHAGCP